MAGLAACLAGVVTLARIPYFYLHSHIRGQQLLHQAQQAVAAGRQSSSSGSAAASAAKVPMTSVNLLKPAQPGEVLGTLSVPTLHLTAPMLQGTQDAQLNVGVGHLTTSVMPGQRGTAILAAHNATWFRHINNLRPGDQIVVTVPGSTYTFAVTDERVVHTGTPVYNSSTPTLVLEACYPLDALYLTPYRCLVFARLVSGGSASTTDSSSLAADSAGEYTAQIPTDLTQQGLTLATNSLPMGKLTYTGSPALTYTESNQPLSASSTLVALYLGWLHASAESSATDLSALDAAEDGAQMSVNPAYGVPLKSMQHESPFDVTLHVDGTTLTQATGQTTVKLGSRGAYRVTVVAHVDGDKLTLTRVSWTPA